MKVYQGPGWATDAMIISARHGPLANVKVRQALSLALNRQSIINAGVQGRRPDAELAGNPGPSATAPRSSTAPTSLAGADAEPGRGKEAHRAGRRGRPDDHDRHLKRGVEHRLRDRRLPAGGLAIGLKVTLKSVSAQDFINFFTDPFPEGRRHVPDRELRRLRGPSRAAGHGRAAGRRPELRQLQRPAITSLLDQARTRPTRISGPRWSPRPSSGRRRRCRGSRPSTRPTCWS